MPFSISKVGDMRSDQLYNTLLDRLIASWVAQLDKPEETPESTLKALCFLAVGVPVSVQKASRENVPDLNEHSRIQLQSLVEKRLTGIPLAHITGRQQFLGMELLAGPEALIPRIETEILGRAALAIAKSIADTRGTVTILDVCTGSGNVALGIASNESRSRVFGADLSEEAITLARKNAQHLNLEKQVEFRQSDLFAGFESDEFYKKMDLVTCNPPYIPSAKVSSMDPEISQREPRLAFDGGSLGISILTRLIRESPKYLKSYSYLCFEVGLGQGKAMEQRLKKENVYCNIQSYVDAADQVRALSAQVM
jgi:release factor glutamine methyltransferase